MQLREEIKTEQINLFMEKVQADEGLAAKLKEMQAKNATVDEFITLAAEHGFTVTKEDVEQPPRKGSGELSEEQLDEVAGGQARQCFFIAASPVCTKEIRDFFSGNILTFTKCTNAVRCNWFLEYCRCWGTSDCRDGYHNGL